jgi:hypothetical protein
LSRLFVEQFLEHDRLVAAPHHHFEALETAARSETAHRMESPAGAPPFALAGGVAGGCARLRMDRQSLK